MVPRLVAPGQTQVMFRLAAVTTRPAAMVAPPLNVQVGPLEGAVTQIMPRGSVSTTVTFVACDGPRLSAVRLYVTGWPASAATGAAVLPAIRLVSGVRVTCASSLLGSAPAPVYSAVSDELMLAVLLIVFDWVPLAWGFTNWRALIVMTYSVSLTGTLLNVQVTRVVLPLPWSA